MKNTLSVIIPVYNEEKTLERLLKKVKASKVPKIKKEIVVVNDGSTDKTREILLKTRGIKLVDNKINKGKGAALIDGLKVSKGEFIIIQDADLEYEPKDYKRLIAPLVTGKSNVVYGSRLRNTTLILFGENKTPLPIHYIANRTLSLITNLLYGSSLTDMETCYKAFRKKVLDVGSLSSNGFEIEPEITAQFLKKGEKIIEVPIKVNPRGYGDGKKITPFDGVIALKKLIQERFK